MKELIKKYLNKPHIDGKKTLSKNALVIYITYPFNLSIAKPMFNGRHSKAMQAIEISNVLTQLGYNVDVIDFKEKNFSKIAHNKYDVIFGMEPNFQIISKKFPEAVKIYYATGCYAGFSNQAEQNRLSYLKSRKNKTIGLRRQIAESDYLEYADYVMCMGNDFVRETYQSSFPKEKIHMINNFILNKIKHENKNFHEISKNFLWLGGYGALHKGLDILIDTFKGLEGYQLYIAGDLSKEKDFFDLYKKDIENSRNIHYLGWVKNDSKDFYNLCKNNTYIIYPSASEAHCGSVLNGMSQGLIPIITKSTGIDINNETGYYINTFKIEELQQQIKEIVKSNNESTLNNRYRNVMELIENNYKLEFFKTSIKDSFQEILNENP